MTVVFAEALAEHDLDYQIIFGTHSPRDGSAGELAVGRKVAVD